MATKQQIDSFYRFATEQLENGGRDKTVDELYDQWRIENLTPEDMAENVAAIQASIGDMNNGERERERDVGDVIQELREGLNVPPSE